MNKLRFTYIALMMLLSLALKAQESSTAYTFLEVSPSSHVYGLGGHNVSLVDDDINLIEQNPALMGPEIDKQIGVNYMRYLAQSNFMGARYGMGINEHSAWAAGVEYYGYGSFTATDPDGTITGKFSAHDLAFSGTYTHDIKGDWRAGITVKVLSSTYERYSALALAADLGISYYNADSDFAFGFVIKNLGGQVKRFNETHDNLPWDIQAGITKGLGRSPFRFSITLTNLRRWKLNYYAPADKNNPSEGLREETRFFPNLLRHITFALEYAPTNKIYIGLGYDYRTRTNMSTYQRNILSGFSLCGGLKVRGFGFGAAVAQPHVGGFTFMLNVSCTLSELMN